MKSLIVDTEGRLSIAETGVPRPGPCQALVRMKACGVCNGTDMKLIHRSFKGFSSYPAILGHEGVGEVVEVGAEARGLHIGDRVLLPFLETETNGFTPGWGAFSEYALVGDAEACARNGMGEGTELFNEGYLAQTVLKPEDRITDAQAVMIITFREVLSAIRRFGLEPNTDVAVFGAGPVGCCFIRFLKLLGVRTVVSVDVEDDKISAAKGMGADAAFNSRVTDIDAELTRLFPRGLDAVIDAAGVNEILNRGLRHIKYNGKVCCYGISPHLSMDLDWSHAPYNWALHFVQWPSKREEAQAHAQIMAWIHMGALQPDALISHTFPFSRVTEAFAMVERRDPSVKKIVITFDGKEGKA